MDECLYRNIRPVTIVFLVADEDATLAALLLAQIVEICDSPLFCIEVAIYSITLEFGYASLPYVRQERRCILSALVGCLASWREPYAWLMARAFEENNSSW